MNAEWFAEHRGIAPATLASFGVKFQHDEVVFPYPSGEKRRYFDPDGKRQFRFTKGMRPELFSPPVAEYPKTSAFLCEGETDTMRLFQELKGQKAVFGLGGVDTWRDHFSDKLKQYGKVYVLLDNDQDYQVQAQVDKVWRQIRQELGPSARRIYLPTGMNGAKDVCEFFELGYDVSDLKLLLTESVGKSRFSPLDLTRDPPPVNWLLDGWFAMGDVTLLSGTEGLGKSQVTMALAVAVANGHDTLLGTSVMKHGRVLYFDEENPEDVVFNRLRRYGHENHGNLRYIWNNAVRLDKKPELMLDEALDYQPKLIVLDSLTRMHSLEENNAGHMAPLLNDCIKPLARETGAAVILIHHHDKGAMGPRGSGDIGASVDGAVDMFRAGSPGAFTLRLRKSRRRLTGEETIVEIQDTPDDRLRLHVVAAPRVDF